MQMVALLENLRREMTDLTPRYRSGELQGKDVEADLSSMLVRVELAIAESRGQPKWNCPEMDAMCANCGRSYGQHFTDFCTADRKGTKFVRLGDGEPSPSFEKQARDMAGVPDFTGATANSFKSSRELQGYKKCPKCGTEWLAEIENCPTCANGEPSSAPPLEKLARDFCRENYGCEEGWQELEAFARKAGAAQEVSPPSPVSAESPKVTKRVIELLHADLEKLRGDTRELKAALSAAIPFVFEYGSHQNSNCHRGSDDGCYCGLAEAVEKIRRAERLLGEPTK